MASKLNYLLLLLLGILPSLFMALDDPLFDLYEQKSLFFEPFDEDWDARWDYSVHVKYNGRFVLDTPEGWKESGLKVPEKSKHYGVAALVKEPIDPSEGVIVQYEVKFSEGITCGGAYLKLITAAENFTPMDLVENTPYTIMFGPDKCGNPGKVHFILRHKNPVTGQIEEKHVADAVAPPADRSTHIYTLRLMPDNSFAILIDGITKTKGNLMYDMTPPINPPAEIPDPTDIKPEDWVDEALIPDLTAEKPDDWDDRKMIEDTAATMPSGWLLHEPPTVQDPSAVKPADWNDYEDGEWEPPQIPNPRCKIGCGPWSRPKIKNPAYKGDWKTPMLDNPDYKGPWIQRKIPNPDHYKDLEPLAHIGKIGAVAIEIWTIDSGYVFDNILITRDEGVAAELRERIWKAKSEEEAVVSAKSRAPGADKAKSKGVVALLERLLKSHPSLAPVERTLRPLLDAMAANPFMAYALLSIPPTFAFLIFMFCYASRKNPEDEKAPSSDDEDEDKPASSKDDKAPKPAARKKKATEDAVPSSSEQPSSSPARKQKEKPEAEIQPEEHILEDEDKEPKGNVRRRVPRD